MRKKRIIPCILIIDKRAIVTTQFANPYYVSDPFNLVRIYNEKQVDELMIIQLNEYYQVDNDIDYLCSLANQCYSPLSIGGGVRRIEDIEKLIASGAEKIILGTHSLKNTDLIYQAAKKFGSSSLTINIDYSGDGDTPRRCLANKELEPFEMAKIAQDLGAGELMFTSKDRNGIRTGYDYEWIDEIAMKIHQPIVVNGGGQSFNAAKEILSNTLISAAVLSTGLFIRNPLKAVLPTYE